jgi:hypothetical protein
LTPVVPPLTPPVAVAEDEYENDKGEGALAEAVVEADTADAIESFSHDKLES